jgi:hypothetical protein
MIDRVVDVGAVASGAAMTVLAQVPSPEMASEWGKFGATAILGVVCLACLWLGWRKDQRSSESVEKLAGAVKDLAVELRNRPCIGGHR